uniref:Uncharacterized protein n=1 Tax=Candidatus Kentrum sp. TUN TaxID=2126343 RepID=A0A450ZZL5_9GAMM|nr:MAG: hypothetical protein BECKTUN1418E_GA0071001_105218 [Candidatus Kentron sp. TUN]
MVPCSGGATSADPGLRWGHHPGFRVVAIQGGRVEETSRYSMAPCPGGATSANPRLRWSHHPGFRVVAIQGGRVEKASRYSMAPCPGGAMSASPGLRRSRYPGYRMRGNPTPTGLRHSQTYCSSHSKPCFRRRVLYSSWKLRSL